MSDLRRNRSTPQFCPSMAYMVRDRDDALVAYQCARPFGHDDERPHRNGIASDAGSWTTEQAMESLEYVLSRMRRLQFAAYEAAQVIGNLVENGPEQGFGYWNEAGHWQDGEKIMRGLHGLSWVDELDAPEDAPCVECGGDGFVPSDVGPYETSYGPSDTECRICEGTGYQPLPNDIERVQP